MCVCVCTHWGTTHKKVCCVWMTRHVCCTYAKRLLLALPKRLVLPTHFLFSKSIGKKKRFYNADRLPVLCFSPLRNWKLKRHQTTKDCGYIVDSCVHVYYSYIYTPASIYANYICQERFTIFIWKDVLYTNRTTICLCVHKNRRLNVQEIFRPFI